MSVPARAYLSIGEVLAKLRGDFPDITISKIRFLESEGLIGGATVIYVGNCESTSCPIEIAKSNRS